MNVDEPALLQEVRELPDVQDLAGRPEHVLLVRALLVDLEKHHLELNIQIIPRLLQNLLNMFYQQRSRDVLLADLLQRHPELDPAKRVTPFRHVHGGGARLLIRAAIAVHVPVAVVIVIRGGAGSGRGAVRGGRRGVGVASAAAGRGPKPAPGRG